MSDRGVFGKYVLAKADGSDLDREACYFILRLDTDPAARKAILAYADACDNKTLADDLRACVEDLERPRCGCREAHCPHERILSAVWHAGDGWWLGGLSENPRRMRMAAGLAGLPLTDAEHDANLAEAAEEPRP